MKELQIKKLYYSISEVSELTSLKPYVLRYWESEFTELRPSKNRAGNRIYKSRDIDLIDHIKKLLYEEKFTIAGAREKLRASKSGNHEAPKVIAHESSGVNVEALGEIRKDLLAIRDLLQKPEH